MVEYNQTVLDDTFHALAHPIRREIVSQLAGNQKTVLQLASHFDISLNGVSKHIKVLEHAGLIQREIQGRTHYCKLNLAPMQQADAWMEHYRSFWTQRLDALGNYLEKHKKNT
jgi:DNA-binding transcriptional ArsR family regulator